MADPRFGEGIQPGSSNDPALHEVSRRALHEAVELLPDASLSLGLQHVAEALPLAISVETATVRVRAADDEKEFHLLAATGLPSSDRRRLAYRPLRLEQLRTMAALGGRHSTARTLGLRWVTVEWLTGDCGVNGAVIVGSRTARRPDGDDLAHLALVGERLGGQLDHFDLRTKSLARTSHDVGRQIAESHAPVSSSEATAALRPRERFILELYADGLSTREIADLLVLSVHTVQTHVKLARRRLGVRSREDAVKLIEADRVYDLL